MKMISAAEVERLLPYPLAAESLLTALRASLDPEVEPPRTIVEFGDAQLLLMPSASSSYWGTKLVAVADHHRIERGAARIQGTYVLMDGDDLAPIAIVDGEALTTRRTAAVSLAAVLSCFPREPIDLTVYGSGVQAHSHLEALASTLTIRRLRVIARNAANVRKLEQVARSMGIETVTPADAGGLPPSDVIVCATTSWTPVLHSASLGPETIVAAIGSHQPGVREVSSGVIRDSAVIVDARSAARRENGNLIIALAEGVTPRGGITSLREVVRGAPLPSGMPRVFLSSGMAWQDLVLAAQVYEQLRVENTQDEEATLTESACSMR